jgi:cell division protein FtsN
MDEGAGTAESEKEQQQFIVFIGRFENQVPSDVARAMLMLEGRYGVVQESKENYTDYYTKPVNSRLEAERIQAAFSEFEVEGTEIRPVSGGK